MRALHNYYIINISYKSSHAKDTYEANKIILTIHDADVVTYLLLKPLIEKDPDEAEMATAATTKRSSTPGCWTAAKVT